MPKQKHVQSENQTGSHLAVRLPPRREPRVLAVVPHASLIGLAVVDPFEVKTARLLSWTSKRLLAANLQALLLAEKPTALVTPGPLPPILKPLISAAHLRQVPVANLPLNRARTYAASGRALVELYPASKRLLSLAMVHPLVRDALSLALYALHTVSFPPRRYQPRKSVR